MADEQIIYLSPEEDLTSVRERLEKVQSKRIILVIPTQTQLRSHVSWRLLHARARELGKDVLIVSSDRQVRSVVKAAGFRVADSLESPPSGKQRRGSRPGRVGLGGKTSPRLRTPTGKVTADQQSSTTMSTSTGLRGAGPRAAKERRGLDQSPQQYANRPTTQQDVEERQRSRTQRDEVATGGMTSPASHTFEIEDVSSSPGFEPDFDYLSSPAPLRPVNPPFEEEEPSNEHLIEDFQQAQNILQAAQGKQAQSSHEEPISPAKNAGANSSTPRDVDDPFRYMEDIQTSPLPEQHASVPIDELDEGIPDISDYPTADLMQIEDQGDLGALDLPDISAHQWTGEAADEEQDMLDRPGPARIHGVRPRSSRAGKIISPPPQPPQPPQSDLEDEIELPPPSAADQPPRTVPPPRQSGALRFSAGNRPPEAIPLGQARTPSKPSRPLQPPPKQRPRQSQSITRATKPPAATAPRKQQRRRSLAGVIALALIILFVLLLVLLAYFGPSADVTITLPSHDFHSQMTLRATSSSRLDVLHQTLAAQTLTFDTSVTGQGHATGSTTVGTKPATGTVVFTNKGTGQIIIPTGTIVATKGGIQFVTQGEVLANNIPTPIQAVNPGVTGNVAANTITVIPPDSLAKIQQANPGATINLTVTNPDRTSGGGAGSATSVTQNDVNKTKTGLDAQLQTQITDFLKKHVHAGKPGDQSDPGDQVGQPVRQETVTSTPLVGSVTSNGNFTETIKLHMSVLVVRVADLQTAAQAQLQETLSKQKSALALVPQQRVAFTQMKNTSPPDGSAVVLSFTATGQVAPQVSEDRVRNLVSGKSVDDAKQALTGGIPNAVNSQVTVSPGFFPRLPFWGPRITVHFKTVPTKATPPPTKKPKKK